MSCTLQLQTKAVQQQQQQHKTHACLAQLRLACAMCCVVDRLSRLVVEAGLGHLPFTDKTVLTPTGIRGALVRCLASCGLCAVVCCCGVVHLVCTVYCPMGDAVVFLSAWPPSLHLHSQWSLHPS